MASIERFEDIEAGQNARRLTSAIYTATKAGEFGRDFGLRDPIRRASVSVMSNIAEGFERGGDREFLQFLSQAKGSAGEVRSQLYAALDAGYIDQTQFETLYSSASTCSRHIAGFMRYLEQSPLKGSKYR